MLNEVHSTEAKDDRYLVTDIRMHKMYGYNAGIRHKERGSERERKRERQETEE